MSDQNIQNELLAIQQELKVHKSRDNTYGNFKYRSCDDILEAVKPLLTKRKCSLVISDEVHEIANIPVITAIATFTDSSGRIVVAKAHAGVEAKKGMDISQAFGVSSSYARKYALNGLFLIDDTKDADTDEFQTAQRQAQQRTANQNQGQQRNANQNQGQQRNANQNQGQQRNANQNQGQQRNGNQNRPIEQRFNDALHQIRNTQDPNLLDTALNTFGHTPYYQQIEQACRARADQMGWIKGATTHQVLH